MSEFKKYVLNDLFYYLNSFKDLFFKQEVPDDLQSLKIYGSILGNLRYIFDSEDCPWENLYNKDELLLKMDELNEIIWNKFDNIQAIEEKNKKEEYLPLIQKEIEKIFPVVNLIVKFEDYRSWFVASIKVNESLYEVESYKDSNYFYKNFVYSVASDLISNLTNKILGQKK